MGDVVSLVEKAEGAIQAEEAAELTKKMMTGGWIWVEAWFYCGVRRWLCEKCVVWMWRWWRALQATQAGWVAERFETGARPRRALLGTSSQPVPAPPPVPASPVPNPTCTACTAAKFDFNDFLKQYKMVTGMGNLSSIIKMMPGGWGGVGWGAGQDCVGWGEMVWGAGQDTGVG